MSLVWLVWLYWLDTFGTARGVIKVGAIPSPCPCDANDDGIELVGCCELAVVGRNVEPLMVVVEDVSWEVEDDEDIA